MLLVDEVDRADEEFEAFLLELLSDFQVTIPEFGVIRALTIPRVVLTSNATRELSDALRRRCLYHYLDFPDVDREAAILLARQPGLDANFAVQIARMVGLLRKEDLKKVPGRRRDARLGGDPRRARRRGSAPGAGDRPRDADRAPQDPRGSCGDQPGDDEPARRPSRMRGVA